MFRGADRQHIRRFQTLENGIKGRFGEHKIRLHIFDDLIAVGILCTKNGVALFTRMQVVEDVTGGTLQQVVDETVAPGSKIECDGYKSYRNLSGVVLDTKKYERGRPSQNLCKPPMWCRIEAPHRRFYIPQAHRQSYHFFL